MSGKIIVIEGLDGCGKTTQFELLKSELLDAKFLTFPNYNSPSGQIITQYLNGEFKETNQIKSSYSTSTLYAVDRYTSFKTDWEKDYLNGKTLISARYTTSNAIYQMTKLDKSIWNEYCTWLYDLEYSKMGMPKPDLVIYLDVPIEVSQELLTKRYNGDNNKKDIHESNVDYLKACKNAAIYASNYNENEKWHIINCCENNQMRSIEDIHTDILNKIKSFLEN